MVTDVLLSPGKDRLPATRCGTVQLRLRLPRCSLLFKGLLAILETPLHANVLKGCEPG